jgi:hypothetical protein
LIILGLSSGAEIIAKKGVSMLETSMPCPNQNTDLLYGILSVVYALFALAFLVAKLRKFPVRGNKWCQFFFLLVIIVGPPLWFLFQFNHMYLSHIDLLICEHKLPSDALERPICESFKYNQELAAKVWEGVSAFVLAVALKKEP